MADEKHSAIASPQMRLAFDEERQVRREDQAAVRCVQCGKRFAQPRWYVERGMHAQFCNNTCRADWEADEAFELVLEGRPEYRGGNWKTQAGLARERDGFCCVACGITEDALGRQMDVHHKVPYRLFDSPQEANQLSNLISLCPSCHQKIESAGRADLPLFGRVEHRRQAGRGKRQEVRGKR